MFLYDILGWIAFLLIGLAMGIVIGQATAEITEMIHAYRLRRTWKRYDKALTAWRKARGYE